MARSFDPHRGGLRGRACATCPSHRTLPTDRGGVLYEAIGPAAFLTSGGIILAVFLPALRTLRFQPPEVAARLDLASHTEGPVGIDVFFVIGETIAVGVDGIRIGYVSVAEAS